MPAVDAGATLHLAIQPRLCIGALAWLHFGAPLSTGTEERCGTPGSYGLFLGVIDGFKEAMISKQNRFALAW